ncbi:histone-lysine N-methyltransferase SMYD3-like [Rhopilema esculentum]|uniref:histone-lysine N-methyltransferase SMYD3-like n=1 Tax=Rhopilema esculentum TaxID=499914 RepID=UPI0031CE2C88|eukprot:gene9245-16932_t
MAGTVALAHGHRVNVFDDHVKGKGLKADFDADAGETVFAELPTTFVVARKQRETTCAGCLGPDPSCNDTQGVQSSLGLRKCSRCQFVYYCGVSCQKKDWLNHKQECKNIIRVQPKRPPDLCLLAARFLQYMGRSFKKTVCDAGKTEANSRDQRIQKFQDFFMNNSSNISEKRKEMLFTFSVVLKQFIDATTLQTLGISPNELIGILCWLTCNCFNILNSDMNSIGVGIYDLASLINHDCTPNCVAVFEGAKVLIRSIKTISKNDEVTISYIESLETRDNRIKELKERYFFQCTCYTCSKESEFDGLIIGKCQNKQCCSTVFINKCDAVCHKCGFSGFVGDYYNILKQQHESLYSKLAIYDASETEEDFDVLHQKVKTATIFIPNESIDMIKCLEAVFDRHIKVQNWELAIESGRLLLHGYQSCYPMYHPVTGIHLFKLGKIEILTDNLQCGLEHLERSSKILMVTHGKEHSLTTTLLETIVKLKEEMSNVRSQSALKELSAADS